MIYFGSHDRNVYALDAETGVEQWRFRTGSNPNLHGLFGMKGEGIRSSPQVVGGTIYVGANDYNVYALDADTGEEQWRLETDSYVYSSPTVVDDTVYVGSRGQGMYALEPDTGDIIWENDVGISGTAPLVADGKVFMGSYTPDRAVSCFDATTGEALWRRGDGMETCSSPTVHQGTVMLGSLDEYVYALNPDTGETEWKTDIGGMQNNASFTAKDGILHTSRYDGGAVALDVETGDILWEMDDHSAGNQAPTVVGDTVVLVDQDARVIFADAETGEITFKDAFQSRASEHGMVSSPIIVDGVLFVGTDNDHTLHAMETGLEGSSEGSRVLQGMKNHHHEWAGTAEQTLQILNTGYHVADNIDDIRLEPDDGEDGGTGPYNGWFENVPNYEGTVDLRGQEVVTVDVGAGEIGHEFAPPAVLIDPGVRVVWKWTGRGGSHNVVIDALNFESELVSEEGYTVGYTFEDADVYRYYCEPHRGAGMKGVVAVGDTDDEVINPDNA